MNKPEKEFIVVKVREGQFNICNPEQKQVQYLFQFPVDFMFQGQRTASFVVDKESAYAYGLRLRNEADTYKEVCEIAETLQQIYSKYFYTKNKEIIKELIAFLDDEEVYNKNNKAYWEYQLADAEYRVEQLTEQKEEAINKLKIIKTNET